MKVIIQRTTDANVKVNDKIVGQINKGFVLLVGFSNSDTNEIIPKMVQKIINLRIFEDENEKLNYSLKDVNGSILSISQFTLYAKLNGRRPSFTEALNYNEAKKLYEEFNKLLEKENINVQTGIFGEDMKVSILNDGPVTITIDSDIDL